MTDEEISAESIEYYRNNKDLLIEQFANPFKYPPILRPVAYFMSGSPGAGKTEVATRLIEELAANGDKILHLDTDAVRGFFHNYNGQNSDLFQNVASMCIESLISSAIKNYQSFILDTNFAVYNIALKNVEACLRQNREITIYYIFQEPTSAWEKTIAREKLEGRRVPREKFIERFISARTTTQAIKDRFGKNVKLNIFINDPQDRSKQVIYYDIDIIDKYLKKMYTIEELNKLIK